MQGKDNTSDTRYNIGIQIKCSFRSLDNFTDYKMTNSHTGNQKVDFMVTCCKVAQGPKSFHSYAEHIIQAGLSGRGKKSYIC